ncbi:MAG: glutaredoxin family protein [Congregibacter sp.]
MPLTLFSTSACHLCDEAETLLVMAANAAQTAEAGDDISWSRVDIADDDALFERYGWLIPVVAREDGEELGWPFDLPALQRFLCGS